MSPTRFPSAEKRKPIEVDPELQQIAGVERPIVQVEPQLEAVELRYDRPIADVRLYPAGSERIPANDVTHRYFDPARSGKQNHFTYVLTFRDKKIPEAVTLSYELVLPDSATHSPGYLAPISWGPDITIGPRG